MKKLIYIVFCAVMVSMLAACGFRYNVTTQEGQIPNPFVDCKTLEEAQELAGFDIALPDKMPEGYSQSAIRAVKKTMIEITYKNGDEEIRICKCPGSEDISGAYNEFDANDTVTVDSLQVTMKGSDGKVNVASWFDSGYAYSITINLVGEGIDKTVVSDMVSNVK